MAQQRITIPRNPKERLELSGRVFAKHQTDGAGSPLNALQENNWTINGPKVAEALTLHTQAETLNRQIEELYRQRDALLEPITEAVKSSRDLLLGIHRTNPKRLGEWGFEVADPAPRRPRPAGGGNG